MLDAVVPTAAPAAVAAVSQSRRRLSLETAGSCEHEAGGPSSPHDTVCDVASGGQLVPADTVFDLASVTKVATSAGIVALIAAGAVRLEDRLGRFVPDVDPLTATLTVRQLLTHTAGLPSVPELHQLYVRRETLEPALRALRPIAAPGRQVAYTSLGYQHLGWIAEAASGMRLDAFLAEAVLAPCGVERARFQPPADLRARIAPAGWSVVRRRVLRGEVHDENAWILGGVCGHTGLFADAADVLALGEGLLDGRFLGEARALLFNDLTGGLRPARSAAFVRDDAQFADPGCATWSHTGYTGTSLCLVPERDAAFVLLTNRVHPARGNEAIVQARAAFHAAAYELLEPMPTTTRKR
jgi:CubicO group peptidase (beta-lactamase class C family)